MIDDAAVAGLFGVPVVVAHAHVNELGAIPEALRSLPHPRSTALRRRMFGAGRLAAARALARCTGRWSWLGAGPHGAPPWPAGLAGSLSHTYELALCVVAAGEGRGLGIDLEPLGSAGGLAAAASRICTAAELERALASPVPATAVLRLFCAKEALYKALPPWQQAGLRHTSVSLEWTEPGDDADPVEFRVAGARVTARALGPHMVAAAVVDRAAAAGGVDALSAAPRETPGASSASAVASRARASRRRSRRPAGR